MTKRMLIDATHPEETRVVVLNENRLEELDLDTQNRKQLKGNIYLAKVIRIEPGLQAAFVDYGGNRHGFLAFSEIHPDYYQIPIADRQRILDMEAGLDEENLSEPPEAEIKEQPAASSAENSPETSAEPSANPEKENTGTDAGESSEQTEQALPEQNAASDSEEKKSRSGRFKRSQPLKRGLYRRVRRNFDRDHTETADTEEKFPEEPGAEADFLPENTPLVTESAFENTSDNLSEAFSLNTDEEEAAKKPEPGLTDKEQEDPLPETLGGDSDNGREESAGHKRPPRFLRQYKIQEVLKRRQILLVQVVKEERGNKGAALTTYLSLAGRYSVLMPNSLRSGGISRKITSASDRKRLHELTEELNLPKGVGLIVRTAGANRPKVEIQRDCEYLLRLWDEIRDLTLQSVAPTLIYEEGNLIKRAIRDIYARDIDEVLVSGEEGWRTAQSFMRTLIPSHAKKVKLWQNPATSLFARYQVEAQLENMLNPVVPLSSGGYLVINQTEALVAIDVNSGRATRERDLTDTALKTNLEAAEEIARQVRLRDLAGLIVIDFIDMDTRKHNSLVEKKLKEALRADRARLQVGHISHFGLLEMSRQRLRPSLAESSLTLCPHCEGRGFVRTPESAAIYVLRAIEEEAGKYQASEILVSTAGSIAFYILNNKRERLSEIEFHARMKVRFVADDQLPVPQYRIERLKPAIAPTLQAVSQGPLSPDLYLRRDFETATVSDDLTEEVLLPENGDVSEASASAEESNSKAGTQGRAGSASRRHRRKRRHGRGNKNETEEVSEKLSAVSSAEIIPAATEAAPEKVNDSAEISEALPPLPEAETVREEASSKKSGRRRRSSFRHRDRRAKDGQTKTASQDETASLAVSEPVAIISHYEPVDNLIAYSTGPDNGKDEAQKLLLKVEADLPEPPRKRRSRRQAAKTVDRITDLPEMKAPVTSENTAVTEKAEATSEDKPALAPSKKRRATTKRSAASEPALPETALTTQDKQEDNPAGKPKRRRVSSASEAQAVTEAPSAASSAAAEPAAAPLVRKGRKSNKTAETEEAKAVKPAKASRKKASGGAEANPATNPAEADLPAEGSPKKGWWKR